METGGAKGQGLLGLFRGRGLLGVGGLELLTSGHWGG